MTDPSISFLLGMARKSGLLVPGQDRVLKALKGKDKYLVLLTKDPSKSVASSAERLASMGHRFFKLSMDRKSLGSAIGLEGCQIVALPLKEGLAAAIIRRLSEGGRAFE